MHIIIKNQELVETIYIFLYLQKNNEINLFLELKKVSRFLSKF